jgi:dTMP kinase
MAHPLFLSLDGPDGAGKSTQCRLLAEWLRGRGQAVTTCIDPGGTAVGSQLRNLLLDPRTSVTPWCEALLYMASRAQLVGEVIRPALAAGHIVLSDRYLLSTVVYQGHGGGLDPRELWEVGRLAAGGLEPDLTLVLDVPPDEGRARRSRPADRIEGRPADYQARVREGFRAEAALRSDRILLIDATLPVDVVQEAIRREVAGLLWQIPNPNDQ